MPAPPPEPVDYTQVWNVESDQQLAHLGAAVTGAGDLDGDGFDDIAVASPDYDKGGYVDNGRIQVFLGSVDGSSASSDWAFKLDADYSGVGSGLGAADFDQDGFSDLLVGAGGYDGGPAPDAGAVMLFPGGIGGPPAFYSWLDTGLNNVQELGMAVGVANDVDGDGYPEALAGSRGGSDYHGQARLYAGSAAGLDPTATWTWDGPVGSTAGETVASGDVDGDGYADVVLGSREATSVLGEVDLFLGGAAGLGAAPAWSAHGASLADRFGTGLAVVDVNGDGFEDVVVGTPGQDAKPRPPGEISIYLGSAGGPGAAADQLLSGPVPGDSMGYAIAGGDLDGDGFGDLFVGSPTYDDPSSLKDTGRVSLYQGGPAGLSNAAWKVAELSLGVGGAVALAGDVDGDGSIELLAGAPEAALPNIDEGAAYLWKSCYGGLDSDADGVADVCDVCPGADDALDTDADGTADGCDPCPLEAYVTVCPSISLSGSCPGPRDLTLENFSAWSNVIVIGARSPGSDALPGPICQGAITGLTAPVRRADLIYTPGGTVVPLSSRPCGTMLQVFDEYTCKMSNTVVF